MCEVANPRGSAAPIKNNKQNIKVSGEKGQKRAKRAKKGKGQKKGSVRTLLKGDTHAAHISKTYSGGGLESPLAAENRFFMGN